MIQRELIKQALARRQATHGNTPQFQRAQEFFESALERPDDCWGDFVREFRRNYTDVTDEIVAVLADTDDPLIIHNMLRVADLEDSKEAEAVRRIARDLDPEKHEVSLLSLTDEPSMHSTIRKKERLPESVRAALDPGAAATASSAKAKPKRARSRRTSKKSTGEEQAS